ncbi:hypothetical protein BBJ28_00005483 [Nothophytophthora sp. Chile5]|nr:hypothetical protein BBJ28_00005483 [Nothophytophthora sp. Chile5]
MQFLDRQNPTTTANSARESVELVIHQLRGELRDSNPASNGAIGLSKHVFVDVSIMTTLNDRPEYQPVGTTSVIRLSKSGVSTINEVVNLSTPTIATKILEDPSAVVIGELLDLSGSSHGRVQLPLRKGWRARLAHRKTPTWYAIRDDASSTVADTEGKGEAPPALLMSLRIGSTVATEVTPLREVVGRFHVKVAEVVPVLRDRERLSVFKRINDGGVSVEITCGPANAVKFRTRPIVAEKGENTWCWGNEWVTLDHTEDSTALETLRASLHSGIHRKERPIDGSIDLLSCLDDAKLGSLDQWIELRDQQEENEAAVIANLHLVVSYIPKMSGVIRMEFAETRVFTESELYCHIEKTFFTCVFNKKIYITLLDTKEAEAASISSEKSRVEVLHVPFDSSLHGASNGLPVFFIQWMGVTKVVGEICLGIFTVDLLSVVDCCSLAPKNSTGIPNSRAKWCELTDKSDPARKTGIVSLRLGFEPANCSRSCNKDGLTALTDHRVASAEVFAVWKKLFYLLDQNGNGQIDRKEFTDVFVRHLDEMVEASDGRKLVQLLFDETNQDGNNGGVPTLQQVETLFTKIDTDHDNFLQRKQQQVYPSVDESVKVEPQNGLSRVEVASPRLQQTKELRRKKREDRSSNQSQSAFIPDPARISEQARREEKALKLSFSSQERSRLNQQVASLEAVLTLERRRFAELAADRQALMRSYQQLHLKHQNDVIQEQTKAKWMKQTIERQQQLLQERETLRKHRDDASIVLQSTVRARLEQKRFQALVVVSSKAELRTDDFNVEDRLGSDAVNTFGSTGSQEEQSTSTVGVARGERDESVPSLAESNGDAGTQYLSNGEALAADAGEKLVANQPDGKPAEGCIGETIPHQEQPFSEGGDEFIAGSSDPTISDVREILEEMTDWVVSAAASTEVNVEDVAVSSSEGSELRPEGSTIIEHQLISPRSHEGEGKDSNNSNPAAPPSGTPTNLVAGEVDLPNGELAPNAEADNQMDPKSLDVDDEMAPSSQASTDFNEDVGNGDGELPTPSNDDPLQVPDGDIVDTTGFNHSGRPNSHQDPAPDDVENAPAITKSELSAEIGQSDHHVALEDAGLASDDPLQLVGLDNEGDGDASIPLESDNKEELLSSRKTNVDSGEDPDPTEIKGTAVSGMVPTSIRESPVQRDMVQSDEDASESEEDDDDDDDSIDSSDLMLEADAMVTLEAGAEGRNISPSGRLKHPRRQGRMDSMKLLADFRQLDKQQ